MNLFKAHIQKDTDPRKLSEYALLERSTLPEHEQARSLLEQWFQDYPSDAEKQSGSTDHQRNLAK